jgi:hypothetical protein
MRKLLSIPFLAVLCACPAPKPMPEDAGEDVPVEFSGDTAGGSIPEIPDGLMNTEPRIDAGPIVIDGGCCETRFRVAAGGEPAGATVRIVAGLAVIADLPLTLANGEWSALACFPLEASVAYRYEFTWDGGIEDGGSIDLEDGGTEWFEIRIVNNSARASASEPTFTDVNGAEWNFYRAVSSCDGLDGSVP